MDVEQEIRALVGEINRAWMEGRLDRLRDFFHPAIVMVPPGFQGRIAGVEACLKSFEEFLAAAAVADFQTSEIAVEPQGGAAVATFRFDMSYRMDGRDFIEAGRDIWVFVRDDHGWRAAWRTQLPIGLREEIPRPP